MSLHLQVPIVINVLPIIMIILHVVIVSILPHVVELVIVMALAHGMIISSLFDHSIFQVNLF
jgi:hypothetical protein